MSELKRFDQKNLKQLGSHTSADQRSGEAGDIIITNTSQEAYEVLEIKFNKEIDFMMINDIFSKIKDTNIQRYYILSTNSINDEDKYFINDKIKEIREKHGCQIIVNGVIKTLKYYLRLIENPDEFIENYVTNLENDTEINYEQKIAWNNIIEGE